MILESKEQLMKQLMDAWEIIRGCDEALDVAQDKLANAHKNLRQYIRQHNDEGTVHRQDGVDSARGMGTRTETEAANVHRMPARKGQYVLRTRRDTPSSDDPNTST